MNKTILGFAAFVATFSPGVLYAQTATEATEATSAFSGSFALQSNYTLPDGFVLNSEPIIEVIASVDLGGGFAANAFVARGITQTNGNEVDFGISYTKEIASGTELTLSADYYFLQGDDMVALNATLRHRQISVEATYYAWRQADALQLVGGYTLPVNERVEARALLVYETGFDLSDIALVGAELNFRFSDRWSIEARYLQPVIREAGDPRTNRFTIGLRYSF